MRASTHCAVRMQRLELLVTLMLVRQLQPQTEGMCGGRDLAELGAAVISLPSGLLAIIGEAIAKVESHLEPCTVFPEYLATVHGSATDPRPAYWPQGTLVAL